MQQPTTWRLEVRSRDSVVTSRTFAAGMSVWIGRDPTCEVVLSDLGVSRKHLCLELDDNRVGVTDRSANGSVVNGEFVHQGRSQCGAEADVRVGPFELRLALDGHDAKAMEHAGQARTPIASSSTPQKVGARSAEVDVPLRRKIHRLLLEHMDLASLDRQKMNLAAMRPKVLAALRRITEQVDNEMPVGAIRERLIAELCDEALGLGPLEKLLSDETITEIMVVDPRTIFFERAGTLHKSNLRFTDDDAVRAVIERIVTPLGRRIDESAPIVDARLADGSRVNAIIPPLALRGAAITIRKFSTRRLLLDDLVGFDALTRAMGVFLQRSVKVRKNILISGGTGSGKTTLLNVLSAAIPEAERIVTIEDAAELKLDQEHVVSLESRPPNMEGKGAYTIRDLVRNALRMRPDRIVVGECRGGEALDMLQAMNTGHEGSMTTIHSNSPREAISRLETLCLMAGLDLPVRAIRQQIASSVHLIVQQTRFSDGSRKITSITEVGDLSHEGDIEAWEIFGFNRHGTGENGRILGEFRATGYMPSYLDEFIVHGLVDDGGYL
jgi:pilus assembly protein CpaF